jgi:hypothetical protein
MIRPDGRNARGRVDSEEDVHRDRRTPFVFCAVEYWFLTFDSFAPLFSLFPSQYFTLFFHFFGHSFSLPTRKDTNSHEFFYEDGIRNT